MNKVLEDKRKLFIEDLPMAREQQHKARMDWLENPADINLIAKRVSTDRFVDTILGSSHRYV